MKSENGIPESADSLSRECQNALIERLRADRNALKSRIAALRLANTQLQREAAAAPLPCESPPSPLSPKRAPSRERRGGSERKPLPTISERLFSSCSRTANASNRTRKPKTNVSDAAADRLIGNLFFLDCDYRAPRLEPRIVWQLSDAALPEQDQLIAQYFEPFPRALVRTAVESDIASLAKALSAESAEFGWIALTAANVNTNENELIAATNPHRFVYYYALRYPVFVIEESGEAVELLSYDRFLVLRSFFPFTAFFAELLAELLRLERCRAARALAALLSAAPLTLARLAEHSRAVLALDAMAALRSAVRPLAELRLGAQFGYRLRFSCGDVRLAYTIPTLNAAYLAESGPKAARIFARFRFEEFLCIFWSILMEKTVVFVSARAGRLAQAIAAFRALLRPFKWAFPIVYSLPEELLGTLMSPLPVFVGVRATAERALAAVLPFVRGCPHTLIAFLDAGALHFEPALLAALPLPLYADFTARARRLFRRQISDRAAGELTVERGAAARFRLSAAASEASLRRALGAEAQPRRVARAANEIFGFFEGFFRRFIVDKLPRERERETLGQEALVETIGARFFSPFEGDLKFLNAFFRTQSFVLFFENDFGE